MADALLQKVIEFPKSRYCVGRALDVYDSDMVRDYIEEGLDQEYRSIFQYLSLSPKEFRLQNEQFYAPGEETVTFAEYIKIHIEMMNITLSRLELLFRESVYSYFESLEDDSGKSIEERMVMGKANILKRIGLSQS